MINAIKNAEVIEELLLDMFGNYVVQKALSISKSEDQLQILNVNLISIFKKLIFSFY